MPPEPSGVPLIDELAELETPTIEAYLVAVGQYVASAGALNQGQKKRAQLRGSLALGRTTRAALRTRVPQMEDLRVGEHEVAGALRTVLADVSDMHPLDGLRLAIEIKPVLLAVGRAIWNRFGDVRTFAVNLHLKFPFAVVGGLMPIPTWEERTPGDGTRLDTTTKIERLVGRFHRAGSRQTEGDAPHLLEAVGVVVFDPDTGAMHPNLPPAGLGLRWDEFIERLATAYETRFEI